MTQIRTVMIDGMVSVVPEGAIGYLHRMGPEPGRWVYSEAEAAQAVHDDPSRLVRIAQEPEAVRRDDADRPLSGWCTVCGQYMQRPSRHVPLLNADGKTHRHSRPWDLGERP
jgi:cytochrome P450